VRSAYEHIEPLIEQALQVEGDLIELGVWRGDTFVGIAEACTRHLRTCHAVDSWQGMAPPTERDVGPDGRCEYPTGGLAADLGAFRKRMVPYGDVVRVWPGWIPEVLYGLPDVRYCFAHVDLDQYAPTIAALEWVWMRMRPGGIVAAHDYFPGRAHLASAAVDEWLRINHIEPGGVLRSRHLWARKPMEGGA